MPKVVFFVDGFNVYHALQSNAKYRKYKWLDYSKFARCFVTSKDEIARVLLFTAYAHWMPDKVKRHRALIRAQQTRGVELVFGGFRLKDRLCHNCRTSFRTYEE